MPVSEVEPSLVVSGSVVLGSVVVEPDVGSEVGPTDVDDDVALEEDSEVVGFVLVLVVDGEVVVGSDVETSVDCVVEPS